MKKKDEFKYYEIEIKFLEREIKVMEDGIEKFGWIVGAHGLYEKNPVIMSAANTVNFKLPYKVGSGS